MTVQSVIVTINGTPTALTYNSTSGKWEATLTAPPKSSGSNNAGQGVDIGSEAQGLGYYPVSLVATDDAGNSTAADSTDATWGNTLRLRVLEITKPVAVVTYPTEGARITSSQPTFRFTVTDEGSGIDPATCYIAIDSGTPQQVTPLISGGVATCTYTPAGTLSEGTHTVEVYGSDYDGNESVHASASFYVDTTAPTINITAPAEGLKTNQTQITVTGVTNDATSSPVTLTVAIGSQVYTPTVGQDGSFSQAVTLTEGENIITITATDTAGLSTSVTRTVTLDTTAPTILSITIAPNPTTVGSGYVIEVEVTDP